MTTPAWRYCAPLPPPDDWYWEALGQYVDRGIERGDIPDDMPA